MPAPYDPLRDDDAPEFSLPPPPVLPKGSLSSPSIPERTYGYDEPEEQESDFKLPPPPVLPKGSLSSTSIPERTYGYDEPEERESAFKLPPPPVIPRSGPARPARPSGGVFGPADDAGALELPPPPASTVDPIQQPAIVPRKPGMFSRIFGDKESDQTLSDLVTGGNPPATQASPEPAFSELDEFDRQRAANRGVVQPTRQPLRQPSAGVEPAFPETAPDMPISGRFSQVVDAIPSGSVVVDEELMARATPEERKYIVEQARNPLPKSQGALGSFVGSFSQDIVPSTAAGIAQVVATPVGAAAGPVGAVAANIGAGMATYSGATAFQRELADKLFGEGSQKLIDDQLRANAMVHPFASGMGKMVASIPRMISGGGVQKALAGTKTMQGVRAAIDNRAALTGLQKAATIGSQSASMASTFAGLSGADVLTEKYVKKNPDYQDASVLNEMAKSAVGGATMAPVSYGFGTLARMVPGAAQVLSKFETPARKYLAHVFGGAASSAAILETAEAMYDTAVNGKPFKPHEILKNTAMAYPSFVAMHMFMGVKPELIQQITGFKYHLPWNKAKTQAQTEGAQRKGAEIRAEYRAREQQARNAVSRVRNDAQARKSPEARVILACVDPVAAGTTSEKVVEFARKMGFPEQDIQRWMPDGDLGSRPATRTTPPPPATGARAPYQPTPGLEPLDLTGTRRQPPPPPLRPLDLTGTQARQTTPPANAPAADPALTSAEAGAVQGAGSQADQQNQAIIDNPDAFLDALNAEFDAREQAAKASDQIPGAETPAIAPESPVARPGVEPPSVQGQAQNAPIGQPNAAAQPLSAPQAPAGAAVPPSATAPVPASQAAPVPQAEAGTQPGAASSDTKTRAELEADRISVEDPRDYRFPDDVTPQEIEYIYGDLSGRNEEIAARHAEERGRLQKELAALKGNRAKDAAARKKAINARLDEMTQAEREPGERAEMAYQAAQEEIADRIVAQARREGVQVPDDLDNAVYDMISTLSDGRMNPDGWNKPLIPQAIEEIKRMVAEAAPAPITAPGPNQAETPQGQPPTATPETGGRAVSKAPASASGGGLKVGSRIPWKNGQDPDENVREIEVVKLTKDYATVRWVGGSELQKLPRAAVEDRLKEIAAAGVAYQQGGLRQPPAEGQAAPEAGRGAREVGVEEYSGPVRAWSEYGKRGAYTIRYGGKDTAAPTPDRGSRIEYLGEFPSSEAFKKFQESAANYNPSPTAIKAAIADATKQSAPPPAGLKPRALPTAKSPYFDLTPAALRAKLKARGQSYVGSKREMAKMLERLDVADAARGKTATPPAPVSTPEVEAEQIVKKGHFIRRKPLGLDGRKGDWELVSSVVPGGVVIDLNGRPSTIPFDQIHDIVAGKPMLGAERTTVLFMDKKRVEEPAPVSTPTPEGKTVSVPMMPKQEAAVTPKEQKKYFIAEIDKAIEGASAEVPSSPDIGKRDSETEIRRKSAKTLDENKAKFGTVTIEVPGDGTFTVLNSKVSLQNLKGRVSAMFPAKAPAATAPSMPSTKPSAIAKLEKRPGAAVKPEWDALTQPFVVNISPAQIRKDDKLAARAAKLGKPNYNGANGEVAATDSHRLVVAFGVKTGTKPIDGYPNYAQIVPGYRRGKLPEIQSNQREATIADTEKIIRQIRQAGLATQDKRAEASIGLYLMPDGTVAVTSVDAQGKHGDGYVSQPVESGELIGVFNAGFLDEAFTFLRKTGNASATLRWLDEVSPAILLGAKEYVVQMPNRGGASDIETVAGISRSAVAAAPKAKPLKMDGTVRPDRPTKNGPPAFDSLPEKSQSAFNTAFDAQSVDGMGKLLYPENTGLRAEFEKRTGLSLPKTLKGTRQAIAEWGAKVKVSVPETAPADRPVRYDPSTDSHNETRLRRGDLVRDAAGQQWMIDRNSGFVLELLKINDKGQPAAGKAVSIDPSVGGHTDLFLEGKNFYETVAPAQAQPAAQAETPAVPQTVPIDMQSGSGKPLMQRYAEVRKEAGLGTDTVLAIRLGDFYEVFGPDAKRVAETLGIALAKRQGIEMAGFPYHAADAYVAKLMKAGLKVALGEDQKQAAGLSPVGTKKDLQERVAAVKAEPGTYSAEAHKEFYGRLMDGNATADEIRANWKRFNDNKDAILADLSKLTKAELLKRLGRMGAYQYKNDTKDRVAKAVLSSIEDDFILTDGFTYQPFADGGKEGAISRLVENYADADIAKFKERVATARAEHKARMQGYAKALTNPETLDEFDIFVRVKSEKDLTPEQLAMYDELRAEAGREVRKREDENKAVVGQVQGAAETPMEIVERPHTKRGHNVFIVTMGGRVDGGTFKELAQKARRMGGNWSRAWKPTDSPAGFVFDKREQAENFMALRQGGVSRVEEAKAQAEESKGGAVEKLREMADRMEETANEEMNRDRKVNTAKRAREAGYADDKARETIRMARTMRNLADAIADGRATHLDGLRNRTQIEALDELLRQAKADRSNETGENYESYKNRPANLDDAAAARYPVPRIRRDNIPSLTRELREKGAPGAAIRLNAIYGKTTGDGMVDIPEALAKTIIAKHTHGAGWYLEASFDNLNRLRRMGIEDLPTLRAALREYIQYREAKPQGDKAKELERRLAGAKIPGFFPTPKAVRDEMLDRADIQPGMKVLEPSAGKADLADAAKAAGGQVDVLEINTTLQDLLKAKGYELVGYDFMEYDGSGYDRVLMNPPFEDGQDIDHVRRAYGMLKPGGKLVAIMSEGPFFRNDKKAVEFRDWLASVGGESEKLPEGSFQDATQVRTTGTATRIVEIGKLSDVQYATADLVEVMPRQAERFTKLTEGLEQAVAEAPNQKAKQSELNKWIAEHPAEYAELENLKAEALKKAGFRIEGWHGTPREIFTVFRADRGRTNDRGFYGDGFYFTFGDKRFSPGEAEYYGKNVIHAYIKADNPFIFERLREYKGHSVNTMGDESLFFLANVAKQFPEIADTIELPKYGRNPDTYERSVTGGVPIRDLPALIEKYDKLLKIETIGGGDRGDTIQGYVYSKTVEYDYSADGGKKGSYEDIEWLNGRFEPGTPEHVIRAALIADAIDRYEGIKPDFHPEGYMTRNPQITEAIKSRGHDAIMQTEEGDEIVVFSPNQIKSAEPLALDDGGNLIGPERWGEEESVDIRYATKDRKPLAGQPAESRMEAGYGPERTAEAAMAPGEAGRGTDAYPADGQERGQLLLRDRDRRAWQLPDPRLGEVGGPLGGRREAVARLEKAKKSADDRIVSRAEVDEDFRRTPRFAEIDRRMRAAGLTAIPVKESSFAMGGVSLPDGTILVQTTITNEKLDSIIAHEGEHSLGKRGDADALELEKMRVDDTLIGKKYRRVLAAALTTNFSNSGMPTLVAANMANKYATESVGREIAADLVALVASGRITLKDGGDVAKAYGANAARALALARKIAGKLGYGQAGTATPVSAMVGESERKGGMEFAQGGSRSTAPPASRDVAKLDAEYMAAVERGNRAKQAEIVSMLEARRLGFSEKVIGDMSWTKTRKSTADFKLVSAKGDSAQVRVEGKTYDIPLIVRDDSGRIIPPSERFNPQNPDIRFATSSTPTSKAAQRIREQVEKGRYSEAKVEPFARKNGETAYRVADAEGRVLQSGFSSEGAAREAMIFAKARVEEYAADLAGQDRAGVDEILDSRKELIESLDAMEKGRAKSVPAAVEEIGKRTDRFIQSIVRQKGFPRDQVNVYGIVRKHLPAISKAAAKGRGEQAYGKAVAAIDEALRSAAQEVKDVAAKDKAISDLTKTVRKIKKFGVGKFTAENKETAKDILGEFTLKKLKDEQAIRDAIDELKNDETMGLSDEEKKELDSYLPKRPQDMTLDEVRYLDLNLRNLLEDQKAKRAAAHAEINRQGRFARDKTIERAKRVKGVDFDKRQPEKGAFRRPAQAYAAYTTRAGTVAYFIEGRDDGPLWQITEGNFLDAAERGREIEREAIEAVNRGMGRGFDYREWQRPTDSRRIPASLQGKPIEIELDSGETIGLHKDEMIGIHLASLNENNMRHLVSERGGGVFEDDSSRAPVKFTAADIHRISAEVLADPDMAKAADILHGIFNGATKDALNRISMEAHAEEVADEPDYYPILTARQHRRAKSLDEASDVPPEALNSMRSFTIESIGATKRRLPKAENPVVLTGAFSALERTVRIAKMYQFVPALRILKAALAPAKGPNGEYLGTLEGAVKRGWSKAYWDNLMDVAKKLEEPARQNKIERGAIGVLNALTTGQLSWNLGVYGYQPISYIGALPYLDFTDWAHGLSSGGASWEEMGKYSNLLYFRGRGRGDLALGEVYGGIPKTNFRGATKEAFKDRDAMRMLGMAREAGHNFGQIGMAPITASDRLAIGRIWVAATRKYKRQNPGISDEDAKRKAARWTEHIIFRSQPEGSPENRSMLQRMPSFFIRAAMRFSSQRTAYTDMLQRAMYDFKEGKATKGETAKRLAALIASQVAMAIVKTGIGKLLHRYDDDEGYKYFAAQLVGALVSLGGIGSDLAYQLYRSISSSFGAPLQDPIMDALQDAGQGVARIGPAIEAQNEGRKDGSRRVMSASQQLARGVGSFGTGAHSFLEPAFAVYKHVLDEYEADGVPINGGYKNPWVNPYK